MAVNAVCILVGSIVGQIILQQSAIDGPLTVDYDIQKLSPGKHGFHIHEWGDVRNGCLAAGGHYNPYSKTHGAPTDENRHVGDLGNIVADQNGVAKKSGEQFQGINLQGEHTVLGRAFVIHEGEDDLGKGGNEESLKTGNAGKRLACCVIGLAKSD